MTTCTNHRLPAEDADECADCGELICPDTGTVVDYDDETGEYWHRDGTSCFVHTAP